MELNLLFVCFHIKQSLIMPRIIRKSIIKYKAVKPSHYSIFSLYLIYIHQVIKVAMSGPLHLPLFVNGRCLQWHKLHKSRMFICFVYLNVFVIYSSFTRHIMRFYCSDMLHRNCIRRTIKRKKHG